MTPADSSHAMVVMAGTLAERAHAAEVFAGWHEFYLLAGTAAVTLVGLLFVSLSFNLDVLLHESRIHLLAHARSTLLNFTYILVISLGFLIPNQSVPMLATLIGTASAVVGTIHVITSRAPRGRTITTFERSMRRRGRIYTVCYAITLLTAIAMIGTRTPELVYNMIGVICALLGNAMGMAWDLLVEVGKLKREMAKETVEQK